MNDETDAEKEPKIHVDHDWKERAREERSLGDDAAGEAEARGVDEEGAGDDAALPPFPEATLATHVGQLVVEATVALGDMEHPVTRKTEPDFGLAKYLIDTLAMLRQKTEGNRDAVESRALDEALYRLQLRFLERTRSTANE